MIKLKSLSFYRKYRYRKGYGIHSPFVYNLITKVIEQPCAYYCYKDIKLVKQKLHYRKDLIHISPPLSKNKTQKTLGNVIKKIGITTNHGEQLFRLANAFQAQQIVQIGIQTGLSSLYLSAHKQTASVSAICFNKTYEEIINVTWSMVPNSTRLSLLTGSISTTLPEIWKNTNNPDLIYIQEIDSSIDKLQLIKQCIDKSHNETIIIINNIRNNKELKLCWNLFCKQPDITVSIDLYSMGLLFLNKKLHKKKYKVYY